MKGLDVVPTIIEPSLQIIRFVNPIVRQREFLMLPTYGGMHEIGVFNNTIDVAIRALSERYYNCLVSGVFVKALVPVKRVFETRCDLWRKAIARKLIGKATVLSRRQVVELYTGPKRLIYERADTNINMRGVSKSDAKLGGFVKFEKCNLKKAPRMINPRSPEYNLELGRYLKKLEKQVYRAIDSLMGEGTVMKGYDVFESASLLRKKWDRFLDPIAVSIDAVKFDMHVSTQALKYEHGLYNMVYNNRKLKRLLRWQVHNTGSMFLQDGIIKYKISGTRASGDINTSLGNVVLMCSMIWSWLDHIGVAGEVADNGDDAVIMMEREDLSRFLLGIEDWFKDFGFRIEIEQPVDEFEQIEFCQSRPIFNGERWVMVRNVFTCLQKDALCLIPVPNAKVFEKWLGAVGECGMSITPGIPILNSFYYMYYRSGRHADMRFKQHVFKNTSMFEKLGKAAMRHTPIVPVARVSFWKGFGITPGEQESIERSFSRGGIDYPPHRVEAVELLEREVVVGCPQPLDISQFKREDWL